MYKLQLRDGIDSIDFINDSGGNFFLLDETFSMGEPSLNEVDGAYISVWGQSINARKFGPREVSFSVLIKGSTRSNAIAQLDRLTRMALRSVNERHFSGAAYQETFSYNPTSGAVIPGNHGLQLIMRYGEQTSENVTGEFGQSYNDDYTIAFYVIAIQVKETNIINTETTVTLGGSPSILGVDVVLTVSPFGYGNPRRITLPSGLQPYGFSVFPSPYASSPVNYGARVVIPGSQIPGSGEALTQFTFNVNEHLGYGYGDGVIIGREAGRSLVNCPSQFYNLDSNYAETISSYVVPVGYDTSTNNYYDIRFIATNPVQVQYRTNGGSWSSTVTPSAYQIVQVNSSFGFYVVSNNLSGVSINTNHVFRSFATSYWSPVRPQINISSDVLSDLRSETGYGVNSRSLIVQPGVHGKYKILCQMSSSVRLEYMAEVYMTVGNKSASMYRTGWLQISPGLNAGTIDFGVLDLSPLAMSSAVLPGAFARISIVVFARIVSGDSSGTITPGTIMLVPFDDERSYVRIAWGSKIWDGMQVVSNFNPRNPIIAMSSRDLRESFNPNDIFNVFSSSNYSMDGGTITLVPGVDNTLVVIPTFSGLLDPTYRGSMFTTGIGARRPMLSIRPAYYNAR